MRLPAERGDEGGFTLLELLVTLALAGLIAGLGLPYLAGRETGWQLNADARLLASELRAARGTALANRTRTIVRIDLVTPGVRSASGAYSKFTAAEQLRAVTAKGTPGQATVEIAFAADGSSSGGEVVLQAGNQTRYVQVDWLTGAVRFNGSGP